MTHVLILKDKCYHFMQAESQYGRKRTISSLEFVIMLVYLGKANELNKSDQAPSNDQNGLVQAQSSNQNWRLKSFRYVMPCDILGWKFFLNYPYLILRTAYNF